MNIFNPSCRLSLGWRTWLLGLSFAFVSLAVDTRANRFPSIYHPDESAKARQILTGKYNFHHPMLMLTATRGLLALSGEPKDPEMVTIAGRWVSALFTSGAILCLVLLAALLSGPLASFITGCLLVTNHQLFELAHYLKEDAALLFGLSAFFLALAVFDRRPTPARALCLGASLGLAVSGKFIGLAALPIAIVMLWNHRKTTACLSSLALCLGGAVMAFALLNLPIFFSAHEFGKGFQREAEFVVSGHKGVTRSLPHGVYTSVFTESTNPAVWLLLVVFYVAFFRQRPRPRMLEWMIAFFPLGFTLLLSFSPKTHHRYFLPATGVLLMLAARGATTLGELLPRGRHSKCWGPLLALVIALAIQMPRFFDYYNAFSEDGRSALAAYLVAHVPPGATIVQDGRVALDALRLPYNFRGKQFAADEGTFDELRAQGVEYIAVAEADYGRFEGTPPRANYPGAANFERRRDFYRRLFAEGEFLFECKAGRLQYLQPHLKLYRLHPNR